MISWIFLYFLWWWIPQCQQQQLECPSTINTANTLPLFLWFLSIFLCSICCLITTSKLCVPGADSVLDQHTTWDKRFYLLVGHRMTRCKFISFFGESNFIPVLEDMERKRLWSMISIFNSYVFYRFVWDWKACKHWDFKILKKVILTLL